MLTIMYRKFNLSVPFSKVLEEQSNALVPKQAGSKTLRRYCIKRLQITLLWPGLSYPLPADGTGETELLEGGVLLLVLRLLQLVLNIHINPPYQSSAGSERIDTGIRYFK